MDANNDFDQSTAEGFDTFDEPASTPAPAPQPTTADVPAVPESLSVADLLEGQARIPWTPADYAILGIFGPTAEKMHSSAIAPIVAAARGYAQINDTNRAAAKKKYGLPEWSTKQGKGLSKSLKEGDVLLMPWYRADIATYYQKDGVTPESTTIQYRPESPRVHREIKADGTVKERVAKYEFVAGDPSIVGLHPATPIEWLSSDENRRQHVDTWLVAEGLFKADAALTGMLLASKEISDEDLLVTEVKTHAEHLDRLNMLMNRLERHLRIPVLCIGGVYNFRNNPEWNSFRFDGKEVWIGIDGDVDENRLVWIAANQMWGLLEAKKKATVKLLTPRGNPSDGGDIPKMGIDDYLYSVGTWDRLVSTCLHDSLPPIPDDDDVSMIGHWRVTSDDCAVEECMPQKDEATGKQIGAYWEVRIPMGGRITKISKKRSPSEVEMTTGVLGAGVSDNDESIESEVEVEVTWKNVDGNVETHIIVGPHSILNYGPDQWDRHGARIPPEVTAHPAWPPRGGKTTEHSWLGAIKKHRIEERSAPTVWTRMGWVPVGDSTTIPSFIVGEQVISHKDEDTVTAPGVGESNLNRALSFGVGDPVLQHMSFDDEEYRAEVDKDLRKVLTHYIHNEPWTEPGVGPLIIAAALRPVVPLRPKGTIMNVGAPGRGKSFTAGAFMGFWGRRPGVWASDDLPGSASDTPTAIELAISRAPVWVIDDYHPSVDGRKAQNMEDKIADIIRSQFNGGGKNRSNQFMGTTKRNDPNTALMVTGENELSGTSVRQRMVTITMRKGSLAKSRDVTDQMEKLYNRDGAPSRLTQHFIRFMQYYASVNGGWEALVTETKHIVEQAENQMEDRLRSDLTVSKKRVGELFADYRVVLEWLSKMTAVLGWSARERKVFGMGDGQMGAAIANMIAQQSESMATRTPGVSLMQALYSTLSAGKAHIINGTDFSQPPAANDTDTSVALSLGWGVSGGTDNGLRPMGNASIGFLIQPNVDDDDEPCVLFDLTTAFAEAQKAFPRLLPGGQVEHSSWAAAWEEDLLDKRMLTKSKARSKTKPYKIRERLNNARTYTDNLVPVRLSTLLEISSYRQVNDFVENDDEDGEE
ncbi:hypothetical protein [Aeromicrobium sp. 179-A 4D2 NHS]|uniref:hypothetical protein n=1 Tax=Aeromicrobium sp. 179-A 4D2 NHS TaxID=3142375 RepID=UPI0039A21087